VTGGGPPVEVEGQPVASTSRLAASWSALAAIHGAEGDGPAFRAAVAAYEALSADIHRLSLARAEVVTRLAELDERRTQIEAERSAIVDEEQTHG
jgi:hypothetical protein